MVCLMVAAQHGLGRAGAVLLFCLFVAAYALYVLFVAVPALSREASSLLESARHDSISSWKAVDLWASAALLSSEGAGPGDMALLVRKSEKLVKSIKLDLYKGLARAMTASRIVESHKHEFHGFGDVRNSKICFVAVEPPRRDGNSLGQLAESIGALARGHVDVAVYFASPDSVDSPAVRHRMFAAGVALRLRVRRVLCGDGRLSLLDCAAEQCMIDGFQYWIPASSDWRFTGSEHWGSQLVRGFKTRADMGAARLSLGTAKTVVFSRGHVSVFGPALSCGVVWAEKVYGNEFVWNVPASTLSAVGEPLAPGSQRDAAADSASWNQYLCRVQKWSRYCSREDVAFYSKLPHPHVDVSLSRQELEAMEKVAKSGGVADMTPILAAQRVAQEAGRARLAKRLEAKAAIVAREKYLLIQYCGQEDKTVGMSDLAARWEVTALLYARHSPRPLLREIASWSPDMVLQRAEAVVAQFADSNKLRVTLEKLTGGLIVLPFRDSELKDEAVALLRNISGEASDQSTFAQLRSALVQAWPTLDKTSLLWQASPPLASDVSSSQRNAVAQDVEEDEDRRKKRPCTFDGVTVPEPWFAMYADEEMSHECYASKRNTEKCCDYKVEGAYCMAAFHGYEAKNMKEWINGCRMPHWGAEAPADDEAQCRWAGVAIPKPWFRRSNTPPDACIAPKTADEVCCDQEDEPGFCIARFESYSAQAVNDWIEKCRGKHWA